MDAGRSVQIVHVMFFFIQMWEFQFVKLESQKKGSCRENNIIVLPLNMCIVRLISMPFPFKLLQSLS